MKTAVIAVPRLEPHRPPPGPAIVAKICADQGHTVTAYDLNIKMFNEFVKHGYDFYGLDEFFNRNTTITEEQKTLIDDFTDHWATRIADEKYDYLMIGIFSTVCHWYGRYLIEKLRALNCQSKIVIGGMGVGTFDLITPEKSFGHTMLADQLIDAFIVGEAESSLIKYLDGDAGAGINNNEIDQIQDLDNLPQPDYSYFDLEEYNYLIQDEKEVYITGSRGCVRKCTYCDVERFWPKYRYRSGSNVANEIISNYEKFGITRFYFTDSLVNGSLKVFEQMCDQLANYKFDQPISWSGQFIFRPKKAIPRDHFATIAAAGGNLFYVGIETGSDRVRKEIGKNFTNEDIDFQFEECSQHGIKIIPLMFSGYLTETLEDHQDNLKIFTRWKKYVANGVIDAIELGSDLIILPGSPVERMIESHGIDFLVDAEGSPHLWMWEARSNPDLTIRERIRRKVELHNEAIKQSWPVWRQASRLNDFRNRILTNNLHNSDQKTFYQIKSNGNSSNKYIIPIRNT
jgi:hypothetical protein